VPAGEGLAGAKGLVFTDLARSQMPGAVDFRAAKGTIPRSSQQTGAD